MTTPPTTKSIQRNGVLTLQRMAAIAAGLALAFGAGQALASRPLGIDVSSYQGSGVNWSGVTFGWAKATEGTYFIDGDFVINENNARNAGTYIGAYHFARPDLDSAGTEAGYFWNQAGGYIKNDGKTAMPALDFETFNGSVGGSYSQWANTWCDDIVNDAATKGVNCRAVLYCSTCEACNFDGSVGQWISWIANPSGESAQTGSPWGSTPCPTCGAGIWGSGAWDVWQYGGSSEDLDVFNGTMSDLVGTLVIGGGGGGGTISSAYVGPVDINANGTMEIFGVGANGDVWHNWQTAPNVGWNGWTDLGNGNSVAGPTISHDKNGLLQAFVATGRGNVYHNYQVSGGGWNGWVYQGAGITNMVAIPNADGRDQVFGIGSNGDVWDEWQTVVNGGWSSWADLSGEKIKAGFKVARNQDGRLEIFGQGANGHVWHNWQTTAGQGWSGWNDMGANSSGLQPQLAVANDIDGSVEVFGVDNSGNVWHNWQTSPNCCWNGFAEMNGTGGIGIKPGFVVGVNADGRLELFGVGSNNDVWHVWQNEPKSGWHTWSDLGVIGWNEQLVVGNNKNGEIQLFGIGNNSRDVWHIWQNSPGGSWSATADQGATGMQFFYGQP